MGRVNLNWVLLCVVLVTSTTAQTPSLSLQPKPSSDVEEDAKLSTPELIVKYGYPAEIHHVRTDDGYILEMHRIPYGVKSPAAPNKKVVFLQHGLLSASSDWVLMGTQKGLAYILADAGYDVWMGNSRGNTYSRKHAVFDPDASDGRFWQFSWHEMGLYDITAEIDYVLGQVGQPSLYYIGHSQGTTQFYVMASERPEYNKKIMAMFSLAPVAFMNHIGSPFFQLLAKVNDPVAFSLKNLGVNEFLPHTELITMFGLDYCNDETVITQDLCANVLFMISGYDVTQLNKTTLPVIAGHSPAGASVRQILHYSQEINSGDFRPYEAGPMGNLPRSIPRIVSKKPPTYDLTKITCPVALFYSLNDQLSSPIDVDRLYAKLPNPIGKFLIPMKEFTHLDFLWAIDVKPLLYDKILSLLPRY